MQIVEKEGDANVAPGATYKRAVFKISLVVFQFAEDEEDELWR